MANYLDAVTSAVQLGKRSQLMQKAVKELTGKVGESITKTTSNGTKVTIKNIGALDGMKGFRAAKIVENTDGKKFVTDINVINSPYRPSQEVFCNRVFEYAPNSPILRPDKVDHIANGATIHFGGDIITKNVVQTNYSIERGNPLNFLKKALGIDTSKMSAEEFYKAIGEENFFAYRTWA